LCGDALSEDFIHSPDLLLSPKYAALSAAWFYNKRGLNKEADEKDWSGMTKKINGGLIGLEDRIKHINHVLKVLTS
jgi:putative chitinase